MAAPAVVIALDGTAKIAFKMRSDARKASRKHPDVYRCRFCGAWHLATKRKRAEPHVRPVVRIRTMANAA